MPPRPADRAPRPPPTSTTGSPPRRGAAAGNGTCQPVLVRPVRPVRPGTWRATTGTPPTPPPRQEPGAEEGRADRSAGRGGRGPRALKTSTPVFNRRRGSAAVPLPTKEADPEAAREVRGASGAASRRPGSSSTSWTLGSGTSRGPGPAAPAEEGREVPRRWVPRTTTGIASGARAREQGAATLGVRPASWTRGIGIRRSW
mmetsp:Transcript_8655/g.15905  ORF Transcript_8655/g.15905 Transcript_8655/m.15905 type:complete len:201 (+) Transcript_8655:797-1399(+)